MFKVSYLEFYFTLQNVCIFMEHLWSRNKISIYTVLVLIEKMNINDADKLNCIGSFMLSPPPPAQSFASALDDTYYKIVCQFRYLLF